MTYQNVVFLLLLPVVLATMPLSKSFIDCPCTFTMSRPLSDDTPFTVIIRSENENHPAIIRSNLTNQHADITSQTAEFRIHVPRYSRHAATITTSNASLNIHHVSHTVCPTLLEPDPPGIFRQLEQRVVGGTSASRDLRSYLAYIYNPNIRRACTGTVVSPRWIVTAAHCKITQGYVVYLQGGVSTQGTPYEIRQIIPHVNFGTEKNPPFDISVIELAEPSDATPMRVSVNPRIPLASSAVRVLGYGSVAYDEPTEGVLLGELRQVDVPVNSHAQCLAAYNSVSELYQVCAGYLGRGDCDSCQGDSGGPLIQYTEDEEPVLVGVVSRGIRCGEARFPGVYVRVGAFENWLDSHIGEPYVKEQTTRAVLAVTGSSKSTFQKVLIPIAAVCLGVLVVGLVLVFVIRSRRRRRESGKEIDEETGSTEGTEGIKAWHGLNHVSDTNGPPHGQRAWSAGARRMDNVTADGLVPENRRGVDGGVLNGRGIVEESDSDISFISEHTGRVEIPRDRNIVR